MQPEIHVSPRELYQRCQEDCSVRLLDVRTPAEFARVHIPGARLVPLDELDPSGWLQERGSGGSPLYIVCQSGARALKAIGKFHRAGYDRCVLVKGGMQAWEDEGLPVERGHSHVLPLMRQVQIVAGLISGAGAALALCVNRLFAIVPLVAGCGLVFAGLTGTCGMALLLARLPWNRANSCSTGCH